MMANPVVKQTNQLATINSLTIELFIGELSIDKFLPSTK